MRKLLTLLALTCAVVMAFGCGGPRTYTKADLIAKNAKEITGTVTKQGLGSFFIKSSDGDELQLLTGKMTQYIPESYRSQEGDKVRASYQYLKGVKLGVLQLEALEVPEKNKGLSSPITAEVNQFGGNQWLTATPTGSDKAESFKIRNSTALVRNSKSKYYSDLDFSRVKKALRPGALVKIEFVRDPLLRGNGYYYRTKKIYIGMW